MQAIHSIFRRALNDCVQMPRQNDLVGAGRSLAATTATWEGPRMRRMIFFVSSMLLTSTAATASPFEGRVLRRGEPQQAAITVITPLDGTRIAVLDSDLRGRFVLNDLADGRYLLEIETHGRKDVSTRIDRVAIDVPATSEVATDIELSARHGQIQLAIEPKHETGTVTLFVGTQERDQSMIRTLPFNVQGAVVKDEITFDDLAPGRYLVTVRFEGENGAAMCARSTVTIGKSATPRNLKLDKTRARACPAGKNMHAGLSYVEASGV